MKIEIISTNGNCRIYWCRNEIHSVAASYHKVKALDFGIYPSIDGIPEMILEIPGVDNILTRGFSIWVSRNPAYDWSEIEPAVIRILEEYEISHKI